MTYKEYLTIQDAADISNKSVQTIRRAIKAGKLKYRKRATPQGFHYSVSRVSLSDFYDLKLENRIPQEGPAVKSFNETIEEKVNESIAEVTEMAEQKPVEQSGDYITQEDFNSFAKTLERLVSQHAEERQNFLRLVNTLQEKIFVLENQINLLKAPAKKWFSFWK